MNIYRRIGIDCLSSVLNKKRNIEIIEQVIHDSSSCEEEYLNIIYHSLDFIKLNDKKNLKTLINLIIDNMIGWQYPIFITYQNQIDEEDKFMTTPFEIEEGVLECKCGSKRTISFQKQIRSADEGSTTFAQCIECGNKWRHNN